MVQDLIDRQLVDNKTQSLENTAFSNATTLMSSSNFAIADECTEAKNVGEMKINTNVFLIWIQKQEAVVQPKC